jgi:hypothetical protein
VTVLSVHDRIDLRDFLVQSFAATEIEDLLFEIGLSTDDLPHATRPELARSVIGHCERTGALGCLLERIMIARPDDGIAAMMARVGPCDAKRVKVQVIFPVDQLRVSREEFARAVANLFHDTSPDSIELIGAAQGGARALVSLPADRAPAATKGPSPATVQRFDTLEVMDQQTWRYGLEQAYWRPSTQLHPVSVPADAPEASLPRPAQPRRTVIDGRRLRSLLGSPRNLLLGAALLGAIGLALLVSTWSLNQLGPSSAGDHNDDWLNVVGIAVLVGGIVAAFAISRLSTRMSRAPAPSPAPGSGESAHPPTWDAVRAMVVRQHRQ